MMETNFGGKQKQKRKKKRRTTLKVKRQVHNTADTVEICLSDFANAPDKRGALKKMSKKMTSSTGCFVTNSLPKALEDVDKTPDYFTTSDDDTAWYDREDVEDADESLNMDGHSDTVNGVEGAAREAWESAVYFGKSYPFDIWCLLANHIKPEQIQTFACICRDANEAVNSVSFWIRLYQNFVMDSVVLPDRLMPDWIESRAGLKMRIVRALFIGYNNLRNFFLRESLEGTRNTQTLNKLVGSPCCQTWYRGLSTKANTSYTFFFKFKHKLDQPRVSMSALSDERDYLTWNCERDFIVLQMTVSNFVCLRSVCGETLTDISVNLSRNMRYHCVKMVFHSYRKDGKYRKSDGTITVLDPVCELRVLRWWYPSYPHSDE